ncbi:TPA: helix-turn-helix domain-containing protein [Escherichia coli]|mgnify:CR=1 FL=1|uniref:helix-turn-helix domain-containing protein n=1 Tax=Citrobacter freundii TaxID=546 RepID=UPI002B2CE249|nr:helix-turn-helix domain-containing protein [Citrobacter freundii]WNU06050.1 helix-turn-helix domain-containing protein [Citrobacter freundii]HDP7620213.1 helix-turn-helix domain-containing protein [Escherichia coli]
MRAPSPKRAKAIALRAEGLTMQEIAAKLGINRGTVSKWLAKERFKTQANELDRLISDAQAKYDSLPPSEAERLRDLRDSLREQQQVIIKRQIKLLESVQGEAMTALRSKDLPTVRAAASLISALTRAFAHEGAVYGIIDPAEAMRQALKDD